MGAFPALASSVTPYAVPTCVTIRFALHRAYMHSQITYSAEVDVQLCSTAQRLSIAHDLLVAHAHDSCAIYDFHLKPTTRKLLEGISLPKRRPRL